MTTEKQCKKNKKYTWNHNPPVHLPSLQQQQQLEDLATCPHRSLGLETSLSGDSAVLGTTEADNLFQF